MFMGKISKGRTLFELFMGLLIGPTFYCLLWFTVWGGVGMRQARQGQELQQLGLAYYNDSTKFAVNGTATCFNVPQEDVVIDGEVVFHNYLKGITPVCQLDWNDDSRSLFDVLYSFTYADSISTGLGPTLSVVTVIALALFFITSYDSAALMMHYMSSNGT
jgi:choline-glycine betaine transporter